MILKYPISHNVIPSCANRCNSKHSHGRGFYSVITLANENDALVIICPMNLMTGFVRKIYAGFRKISPDKPVTRSFFISPPLHYSWYKRTAAACHLPRIMLVDNSELTSSRAARRISRRYFSRCNFAIARRRSSRLLAAVIQAAW